MFFHLKVTVQYSFTKSKSFSCNIFQMCFVLVCTSSWFPFLFTRVLCRFFLWWCSKDFPLKNCLHFYQLLISVTSSLFELKLFIMFFVTCGNERILKHKFQILILKLKSSRNYKNKKLHSKNLFQMVELGVSI